MGLVSSWLAPHLQIFEIFRVIGAKPHHHGKVADHGGEAVYTFELSNVFRIIEPCVNACLLLCDMNTHIGLFLLQLYVISVYDSKVFWSEGCLIPVIRKCVLQHAFPLTIILCLTLLTRLNVQIESTCVE